jgi:hypothetical protein
MDTREEIMTATTDISLPDIQDAILSWDTLDQLFFDLTSVAELQDILVKERAQAHARHTDLDLTAARHALDQGMAVQIRYRYGGTDWCDSLIAVPAGIRLVRIGHTMASA